ncbi:amino acid ABC transporter permease [Paenibacillus sabinae]|uniref:Polar amino acid ABC transporter inner membrane subunit n=1 Tax=Paenibacillus sabinae T27 TaxID=1268072 RepID=X4ZH13_9BACL|nr:amino acid ABC transporter permease [Paenibacillus sabinae]AHV96692.1 polar amino acid ABC transporter inner membrane subunit [Paenibacillus sabinae T27]
MQNELIANLIDWAPKLGSGLWKTILLTLVSFPIALVIGLLLAMPRIGKRRIRILSIPAGIIVEVIRGTPLILQLFYIYFVLPYMGIRFDPFQAGILGLALNYGAYLSEVYRSGIEAIPRTQWEAAKALNMSWAKTMRLVILPQTLRVIMPSLGNYLVSLFKDSALASTISVTELMFAGRLLSSDTFQYITIYTAVFIIYFIISYPAMIGVRMLEKKLAR